jgi:intracellular sulfur oxidation DsrE/DsrF family protein
MAEEPIRKDDIIDVEGVKAGLTEVIKLISIVIELQDKIVEKGKSMVNPLGNLNASAKEDQVAIAAYSKEVESLVKSKKSLADTETKLDKLSKQLNATLKDSAYKEAELKRAIQENNKANSDQVRYNNAAEGSLTRLRIELERMKKKYSEVSPEVANKMQPAIKKLTDEVNKAEKAIGVHSRGVGNYKNSIVEAGKSLAGFLGVAGGGMAVLAKLKDAFMDTEFGVDVFKRGATAVKSFFNSLVTGNMNMAAVNAAASWEISKQYSEIRKGDREDLKNIAQMEVDIQLLRLESSKAGLSEAATLELINKASEKENELIAYKIKDKQEELDIVNKLIPFNLDNLTLLNEQARLEAEIISLTGDKSLRIAREKASLEERIAAAKERQKGAVSSIVSRSYIGDVEVARDVTIELNQIAEAGFIDRSEWYKNQVRLVKDAAAQEIEIEKQKERDKREIYAATFDVINSLQSIAFNNLERQKQAELKRAGTNAKETERINKEYGKKQKDWSITMAVINGALAVTQAWANESSWIAALARSVAAVAATAVEISTISSQEFARGGSGILEGAVHASGGVRIPGFGIAEAGEHLSVTSRAMTSRYGANTLDAISNSINQGKFFEVWGNAERSMNDPFTKKMYELMLNTPSIYQDSYGNTIKQYPNGRTVVIKKMWLN